MKFSLSQKTNILFYKVFECSDVIEVSTAHFFKENQVVKSEKFLTNYIGHSKDLSMKEI